MSRKSRPCRAFCRSESELRRVRWDLVSGAIRWDAKGAGSISSPATTGETAMSRAESNSGSRARSLESSLSRMMRSRQAGGSRPNCAGLKASGGFVLEADREPVGQPHVWPRFGFRQGHGLHRSPHRGHLVLPLDHHQPVPEEPELARGPRPQPPAGPRGERHSTQRSGGQGEACDPTRRQAHGDRRQGTEAKRERKPSDTQRDDRSARSHEDQARPTSE